MAGGLIKGGLALAGRALRPTREVLYPDRKLITTVDRWWQDINPFDDYGLWNSNRLRADLVGSRARGTSRPDSDYDVALVFPRDRKSTRLNSSH